MRGVGRVSHISHGGRKNGGTDRDGGSNISAEKKKPGQQVTPYIDRGVVMATLQP